MKVAYANLEAGQSRNCLLSNDLVRDRITDFEHHDDELGQVFNLAVTVASLLPSCMIAAC